MTTANDLRAAIRRFWGDRMNRQSVVLGIAIGFALATAIRIIRWWLI